jgi:hypothetical protein
MFYNKIKLSNNQKWLCIKIFIFSNVWFRFDQKVDKPLFYNINQNVDVIKEVDFGDGT